MSELINLLISLLKTLLTTIKHNTNKQIQLQYYKFQMFEKGKFEVNNFCMNLRLTH